MALWTWNLLATARCLQVSSVTSFGVDDLHITTAVTLENIWSNTLYDVQYMRSVDPDMEAVRGCMQSHWSASSATAKSLRLSHGHCHPTTTKWPVSPMCAGGAFKRDL